MPPNIQDCRTVIFQVPLLVYGDRIWLQANVTGLWQGESWIHVYRRWSRAVCTFQSITVTLLHTRPQEIRQWRCEISSLEFVFGIESSLTAEFKQLCTPAGPGFLRAFTCLCFSRTGTLLSPSHPTHGGNSGNQTAHLIGLFTLKTHTHTHKHRKSLLSTAQAFFVCLFAFPAYWVKSSVPLKNKGC